MIERCRDNIQNSFAIKGTVCHTPTPDRIEVTEGGYAVCADGVSMGVFKELPSRFEGLSVLDFKDALVMPGMVDLHTHAPQYTYRGMCMDLELMSWLESYTFPEEQRYADLEYARRAYGEFCRDLAKGATTRACIFATRHRPATELLMSLMEDTGLVSYVGKVNMDRDAGEELTEDSAEISAFTTFGWINGIRDKFQNTYPILTPRFIPCCTDKLMEELREIQMAYSIPVQSHLSESKGEIELVKSLRPGDLFYGDSYDRYDLFGKNDDIDTEVRTVMAHCVWSTDGEVELMVKNGVFCAHCPTSNMNLRSGIAPIRKYLDKGLRVGLGTDVAGGHSLSVFFAIEEAVKASKMYNRMVDESASPITFPEAFYMATKGGGAFFGKVGSFEEGYCFDCLVIDDGPIVFNGKVGPSQRLERAVYLGLDRKGLLAKFVNGKKIDLKGATVNA